MQKVQSHTCKNKSKDKTHGVAMTTSIPEQINKLNFKYQK